MTDEQEWNELYRNVEKQRWAISRISHILFDVDRMPLANIIGAVEQLKAENDEFHASQMASAIWSAKSYYPNKSLKWSLIDQELRDMGKRIEERIRLVESVLSTRFRDIEQTQAEITSQLYDIAHRVTTLEGCRG